MYTELQQFDEILEITFNDVYLTFNDIFMIRNDKNNMKKKIKFFKKMPKIKTYFYRNRKTR